MSNKQQISPQDIVILLKIGTFQKQGGNELVKQPNPNPLVKNWQQQTLAVDLGISQSEISKSLNRSKYAGLLDPSGTKVMKLALMEFLQYGLRYVFPQKPGPIVRGIPTSNSAGPLKEQIQSEEQYVWPYSKGNMRGQAILPLYPSAPEAALKDKKLYELLALVDALRVGRAREKELAVKELKIRLGIGE